MQFFKYLFRKNEYQLEIKEDKSLPEHSDATGKARLVPPMANAIAASGADGIMIEVHNDPENALSDGKQSLSIPMFKDIMGRINMFNKNIHYEKNCLSANTR